MPRVIVTNRGTALMNFVAKVLPETAALLCHFHIERNVRVKCITNRWVKPKSRDVKVDEKDKEVKEVKASGIVNNIMRAWDNVVESMYRSTT